MDFLSIIIVAAIVIWFVAAIRYMIKNKSGCTCGGCAGHNGKENKKSCSGCNACGRVGKDS